MIFKIDQTRAKAKQEFDLEFGGRTRGNFLIFSAVSFTLVSVYVIPLEEWDATAPDAQRLRRLLGHCVSLAPTSEELDEAQPWVAKQDARPAVA